jgi:uncharacterized protein YbjT (DUF2867 family)
MTILVTGATGTVGRLVVDRLLAAGQPVRALTRRPGTAALPAGVDVVGGDLERPASLGGVFDGVERMYLFPAGAAVQAVVAAARAAGVRRIVVLSGATAGDDLEWTGYRAVERAVEESGLAWTHVRPGEFAGNWLGWAPSIRAERVVRRPYRDAVTQPTHEADVADVAAAALLQDGHAERRYTFAGPEALTTAEQVRAIGAAIGADIRFEELAPDEARAQWVRDGYPPVFVDWIFAAWADSVRDPSPVNEEWAGVVPRLTGRPARTFATWAAEHADAFR